MSLDLLKERFGGSISTDKKEVDKKKLNEVFNPTPAGDIKSFKDQYQGELEEKDRIIENLKQELDSQWLTNQTAFNTKKLYEDKIKKMNIVDSTNLIPTLIEVSKQKQGNVKLDWMSWLEIPESNYLFQINESLAKKVFQENNNLIEKDRYGLRGRKGRGGDVAVDTDYALTFGGDSVTDYVSTTFNPDNYDGTGTGLNNGFTVSYWVKPAQIGGVRKALGRRPETDGRWEFGIKNADDVHVGVGATVKMDNNRNAGVEGGTTTNTGHGMTVGNWYHWVVTYGGDDAVAIGGDRFVRIWINGKEIYKNDAASGTGNENGMGTANWRNDDTNTVNAASNLYFGARAAFQDLDTPYNQGWACSLSEVAIYKDEKDEDGTFANEVYNAGFGYDHRKNSNLVGYWRLNEGSGNRVEDLSGNGNHGTLTTDGSQIPTWTKHGSYK